MDARKRFARYDGAVVATLGGIVDRVRHRGARLALDPGDRLEGETVLVTGANRGLGRAVAVELARLGAHVVCACRNGLVETTKHVQAVGRASAVYLDLGNLDAVEETVRDLAQKGTRVGVAVLNAGVVPREGRRTKNGFDESFQVNFLANALFARRLVDRGVLARDGAAPRLVVVSSESHRSAPPIDWANFGVFRPWGMRAAVEQYGASKLLLQTFTEELARRTRGAVAVHSMCPGAVRTDIGREAPAWAKPALALAMAAFFAPPEKAARPVVYLAAARAIEGETGIYLHGQKRRDASDEARRPDNGARIWTEVERLLEKRP